MNEASTLYGYLARHNLQCDDGYGLNSFQLVLNDDKSEFMYKYKCCALNIPCTNTEKYSTYQAFGDGYPVYLDRHSIDCNSKFMTGFQLMKADGDLFIGDLIDGHLIDGDYRYRYNCCEGKYGTSCIDIRNDFTSGNADTKELSLQNVSCPERYVISWFHLMRDSIGTKWTYKYRCCIVHNSW